MGMMGAMVRVTLTVTESRLGVVAGETLYINPGEILLVADAGTLIPDESEGTALLLDRTKNWLFVRESVNLVLNRIRQAWRRG